MRNMVILRYGKQIHSEAIINYKEAIFMNKIINSSELSTLLRLGDDTLNYTLEKRYEYLNETGKKAFCDAVEIGIQNTIAALLAADVDDEIIICIIRDIWGISQSHTEEQIAFEKEHNTNMALKVKLDLIKSGRIKENFVCIPREDGEYMVFTESGEVIGGKLKSEDN